MLSEHEQLADHEARISRHELPAQEDDWLDISKACNLDDPECEACQ